MDSQAQGRPNESRRELQCHILTTLLETVTRRMHFLGIILLVTIRDVFFFLQYGPMEKSYRKKSKIKKKTLIYTYVKGIFPQILVLTICLTASKKLVLQMDGRTTVYEMTVVLL